MTPKRISITMKIQMTRDGRLSAAIEEDRRREVITSYSQLLCGAFDIAGEHEAEVKIGRASCRERVFLDV